VGLAAGIMGSSEAAAVAEMVGLAGGEGAVAGADGAASRAVASRGVIGKDPEDDCERRKTGPRRSHDLSISASVMCASDWRQLRRTLINSKFFCVAKVPDMKADNSDKPFFNMHKNQKVRPRKHPGLVLFLDRRPPSCVSVTKHFSGLKHAASPLPLARGYMCHVLHRFLNFVSLRTSTGRRASPSRPPRSVLAPHPADAVLVTIPSHARLAGRLPPRQPSGFPPASALAATTARHTYSFGANSAPLWPPCPW